MKKLIIFLSVFVLFSNIFSFAQDNSILVYSNGNVGIGTPDTPIPNDKLTINGSLNVSGVFNMMPVGTVLMFTGSTAPNGFFVCDGTPVSRTTYANLFSIIGTTFGIGDGSSTFNLPDMRESVPVGAGTLDSIKQGSNHGAIATHDSYSVGIFKDDQVQGHKHKDAEYYSPVLDGIFGGEYGGYHSPNIQDRGNSNTNILYTSTPITDGTNGTPRAGTTTHGKQLGLNFIIKY